MTQHELFKQRSIATCSSGKKTSQKFPENKNPRSFFAVENNKKNLRWKLVNTQNFTLGFYFNMTNLVMKNYFPWSFSLSIVSAKPLTSRKSPTMFLIMILQFFRNQWPGQRIALSFLNFLAISRFPTGVWPSPVVKRGLRILNWPDWKFEPRDDKDYTPLSCNFSFIGWYITAYRRYQF